MPADIHLAIISAAISRAMKHIKSPNDALRTSFRYENLPTDYRPSAAWQSIFHEIIYTTHNSRKNGLKLRQFTFFPNYALFIERGCQNASLSGSLCFELTEQKSLDSSHGVKCLLAECLQLHILILLGVQQWDPQASVDWKKKHHSSINLKQGSYIMMFWPNEFLHSRNCLKKDIK